MRGLVSVCAVMSLALGLAPSAHADDSSSSGGKYEIGAYVWGTSTAIDVDSPTGHVSTHISFSELFDHLSGGLQAHARGEWDGWSVDLDGSWAKLRGKKQSKTVEIGPLDRIQAGAEVKSGLDEWIVEATGGYRLFELGSMFSRRPTDERHVRGEAYVGARYWSIDPKIQVQVNATKFRLGDRADWVDPIIGLRFAIDLSPTVVLRINGDVGGFNLGNYSSDFTWSQVTALSWAFGESWSAHVGYKFLDTHQESGGVDQRTQLRGPFVAASYRF
jgi:hypothetical protein